MSDRICSKCEQDAEFDFTFLHGEVICKDCEKELQAAFEKATGVFPYQNSYGGYCLTRNDKIIDCAEEVVAITAKVAPVEHNEESLKFAFPVDTDREEVVEWLLLAVADAEITLGEEKVKQELQYAVSPKNRTVEIDTSNEPGEIDTSNEPGKHVAKIFGELVARVESAKKYLEKMRKR
jgi:hypothetical protein